MAVIDPTTVANVDPSANLGLGGTTVNPFLTGSVSNPYLNQNIQTAQDDLVRAYNLAQAPAQNAAAVKSGSFGNSALGEMATQDQNLLQKNLGNLANSALMQDYANQQQLYMQQQAANTAANQWNLGFGLQQNQQAYNQNMGNLQAGIGLLGTLNGYNTQDLSTATTAQDAPANYWSMFTNGANSLGGQGGQATTTQGTSSNPLLSAAGGAQLGSNLWSNWGNGSSSGNSGISAANQANFDSFGSSNGWWGTA